MSTRTRRIPRLAAAAGQRTYRRQHKRYPAGSVLAQVIQPGQVAADAWPVNLSTHGVGLVLLDWFEPGAVLTLRLDNARLLFCWTGEVRLVHCQYLPDGHWFAGGPFLEPMPADALRMLLR
jgi:hypothetical protein